MSTNDRFVSIQPKRIMGFLDFRDRFLDYMKAQLQDIVEVAYGDDGTVGGTVTMSEFGTGQNRFQIANDIIGSDGQGHFLKTNLELSGRDVGLMFPNSLGVDYKVALHYAERPRGIQVNPRTGFPEFLEFEETIGSRAEPDLVTDNGGNITFRVNSVARLYPADAALDQTGRRCLVWKKTPGKTAITEGLAVELCTIALNGGNNEITTAGVFGQTIVSTNVADYFVLLLGPTVSLYLLGSEPGYQFIGTVTGAGSGNTPAFDYTGQNNIGPLLSDINVISQVHHGNRKLRVQADNLDVEETQLEIRGRPDLGFPLVMSVDEDGDTFIDGTLEVDGAVQLDSTLAVAAKATLSNDLEVDGATQLDGTLAVAGTASLNGDVNIGNAEADTHIMKGGFTHRNNANDIKYQRDAATGETGVGGARVAGKFLATYGDTRIGLQANAGLDSHEVFGDVELKSSAGITNISLSSQLGIITAQGAADLRSKTFLGRNMDAGTAEDGEGPRLRFGPLNSLTLVNMITEYIGAAGELTDMIIRTAVESNAAAYWITINAQWDETGVWYKDRNFSTAIGIRISNPLGTSPTMSVYSKDGADNTSWALNSWTNTLLYWNMNSPLGIGDLNIKSNLTVQGDITVQDVLDVTGAALSHIDNLKVDDTLEVDTMLFADSSIVKVGESGTGPLRVHNDLEMAVGSGQIMHEDGLSGLLSFGSPGRFVGANLRVDGTLQVDTQIESGPQFPLATVTHDLGSNTLRWRDLYLRNAISNQADGYRFQTAPTFTHWLGGHEFISNIYESTGIVSTRSGHIPQSGVNYGSIYLNPDATYPTVSAQAAIKLPHGATITGVTLYGYSNHASNCKVGIIRQKLDATAASPKWQSLLSTATPSGTDPNPFPTVNMGVTSLPAAINVPVDQNLVIDNSQYQYIMLVYATGGAGMQLAVSSVNVTYTLPALAPA